VIAGVGTAYAMKKRSVAEYARERVSKLLVPLAAGLLLVVPAQTYFAERFHNDYTGGYFGQYILFFTKPTDLSGYTGGFTPGHLWFILYLFIISLAAIPVIIACKRMKRKPDPERMPVPVILSLFILPLLGSAVLDISGKSFGEYFAFFLLGYFLLSVDGVVKRLEAWRVLLLGISLACIALMALGWFWDLYLPDLAGDIFSRFYAWSTILALFGLGRKYLNMAGRFTSYMSRSSFSVYIFHQTWIVVFAFYVFRLTDLPPVQMVLILLCSAAATFATYEICKRIRVTRFLFAIKE
jgi:surface polysaccharide O-acyltransferase-like enzyme